MLTGGHRHDEIKNDCVGNDQQQNANDKKCDIEPFVHKKNANIMS